MGLMVKRKVQISKKEQQTAVNIKKGKKTVEYEQNVQMVDDYNALIDEIRSIHKVCSDPINWEDLKMQPAPFSYSEIGPLEKAARQKISEYRPSLLEKVMASIGLNNQQKVERSIQLARQQDQESYNNWENLHALACQVLNGNVESYFYVINEMHPFEDILDFGSNFEVGTDSPELMEVEFHAKTTKVVPNHVLSLTQRGKLSSKVMTKKMHFDIVQDYICSCTLRIAREMFALLPIQIVIIHVVDTIQDSSGDKHDDTVLSVLIRREQIENINFDTIDTSNTIESFKSNMKFKKTRGLKPVARIDF